jgi:hypothetical protein
MSTQIGDNSSLVLDSGIKSQKLKVPAPTGTTDGCFYGKFGSTDQQLFLTRKRGFPRNRASTLSDGAITSCFSACSDLHLAVRIGYSYRAHLRDSKTVVVVAHGV